MEFAEAAEVPPAPADALARVTQDPRRIPGLVYLRCRPDRILVWNGFHEFENRTVTAGGRWVDAAESP